MKGNTKIIATLNELLAEELTAISQYMVHAEMVENWGLEKLKEYVRLRAMDEMKHAEILIERILFLEGMPIVDKLNKITIGQNVVQQLKNDLALEMIAIESYNRAIKQASEEGDNATREILVNILEQEDHDVDEIEKRLTLIDQMGIENYLSMQV